MSDSAKSGHRSEKEIFFEALEKNSAAERSAFLDSACGNEPVRRARVEALLADHFHQDVFMRAPALEGDRPTIKLDLPPPAAPAQAIGRYKLLEQIGEGGFGEVWMAEQREPVKRRVALKIIKLGMDSRQVVARFEAERQALAMMEHANIAKIFDAGVTDTGRPYFVMELVRGIKITEYCDQNQLSTRERLRLFILVCQAIQHAHQKGVIHRDVKPSNILVTLHDGVPVPKVIDFGIAKATQQELTDKTVFTQFQQFIGTPAYISPEQAEMSGLDIDTRADIYSLGVLLYELLVGQTPFDTKEMMQGGLDALRQIIREREPQRPSTRLNTLPGKARTTAGKRRQTDVAKLVHQLQGDLDWIVMKCLEKDRTRRYETANGLAADIQRHLANEPVVARPPSTAYRFQKAWQRNKPAFAAGAVMTAALVIGLGAAIVSLLKAQTDRKRAVAAQHNESLARTHAEAAGQTATRERERAVAELWNSRLNEAKALRIAGGPGARVESAALLREVSRRPNLTEAQLLALRGEAIGQLALVDIAMPTNWIAKRTWHPLAWNASLERFVRSAGSNRLEVCEFPSERVLASLAIPPLATFGQGQFTPNDRFLAVRFENPAGLVWAWRVDTQEVVMRGQSDRELEVSPDSRSVMLLTSRGLVVQPLPGTAPERVLQPGRTVSSAMFSPNMKQIAVLPESPTNTVEVWNADSGETECSFVVDFRPERIAWHPDGTRLALSGDRGRLELRTLEPKWAGTNCVRAPQALQGHWAFVHHLRFAPDGSTLLTYAWDQSGFLWDLVTGRPLLRELRVELSGISAASDRVIARREWPLSESVAELLPRTGYRTVAWAGQACEANGVWLSPDGRLAALSYGPTISDVEGDCVLWDLSRGQEIARFKGICAQFSADSRTLFTFERYAENRVRSFDVSPEAVANPPAWWQEGTVVYRGQAGERINTGTLAPDGRTLVIAANDAVIFLDPLGERPPRSWARPAHAVSLSRDGRWIATMRQHYQPVLWAVEDGRPVFRAETYSQLKFSPDSRWFSVATRSTVQIHALDSLRPAFAPIALEAPGSTPPVAFSTDSRMFAVPFNRTHVRLYETASGRELATLSPPNPAPIHGSEALKFSADGQWLLAAKDDGETVAWDLQVIRRELAKLNLDWSLAVPVEEVSPQEADSRKAVDFSGLFGQSPPVSSPPPKLVESSAPAGALDLSLLHSWENTQILGFDPQGRLFVHNGARQRYEVHDLAATNSPVTGWKNPDGGTYASGSFSPEGCTLATVTAAGKDQSRIRLWNSVTGEPLGPTFAPTDVAYLAFSPDGKSLAGLGSLDGTVRIWDVASGELRSGMALPEPPQVAWTGIQFSPDGRYVAARNSFAVTVWNVMGPKPVPLGKENLYLTISPDWKLAQGVLDFATARHGFRIELLDFADPGKPGRVPPPLANEIGSGEMAAGFSLDGRLLALSGRDGTIRFWDTVENRRTDQPTLKMGPVSKLNLGPDNRLLLAYELDPSGQGGIAGKVRLWDAATGQPCGPPHPVTGMVMDCSFDRTARFVAVSLLQGNDYGAKVWKLPPGKAPPPRLPEPATSGNQQSK